MPMDAHSTHRDIIYLLLYYIMLLIILPKEEWLVPRQIAVRMGPHPSDRGQDHRQGQNSQHATGIEFRLTFVAEIESER